ncbi:MAG TPA: M1 family aminopeptidase, partial [Actinomycetota bacterium]|nr:M1 family aminopeptidase [Actinomycetota bacterium]
MATTFAPPSALTKLEAQTRAGLIDDVAYLVKLDLTDSDETYESDTTVEFTCTQPGSTTFVDLVSRSVSAIELNGEPIPLDRFVGDRIELANLPAHNTLRVVATCPFERTGVGLHRFVDPADGRVYVYSDFEPYEARRTFTCFDQPDIKGTFDFEVKAPEGWTVVSCTRASSSPSDGAEGVWIFETTPKMSTYVTAVCAGPWHSVFDEHAGIRLGLFCRQSLAEYLDPEEIFEITKAGFDFYNEEFDFPYVLDTYDHVFCPEYNQGAMENFGCITVAEVYIFRSKVTDTAP